MFYNKAYEIWSTNKNDYENYATYYNNIGFVYYEKEDFETSLNCYNKCLSILREQKNTNLLRLASTVNNIALLSMELHDFDKASENFLEALDIQEKILGKYHPIVGDTNCNLGMLYNSQNDYKNSFNYYFKALDIYDKCLGKENLRYAHILNEMGVLYAKLNDYEKAKSLHCQALDILSIIFDKDNLEIAQTYNYIAYVYNQLGMMTEAYDYYEKELNIKLGLGIKSVDVSFMYETCFNIIKDNVSPKHVGQFENFISGVICEISIQTLDSPAYQKGMSGSYVLLEMGNWNIESIASVIAENYELYGKPKNILVMNENYITPYYFENKIGAAFSLKYVGKEEKLRIINSYHRWQKKNKK